MKKVLVGGCFDLLHFGHIEFLRQSKALGDWLVVALESDENVRKMKGESRPIHSQAQRKAMLEAISTVDEVIALPPMYADKDYDKLVKDVRPSVLALTEGDPMLAKEERQAESIGARLVIVPKTITPSTSALAKLLGLE
ncbi:adenylyltransferase/cytidyltransferase family protein [Candidatus Gottesmanbacteria bacterium]|nr:adenylyltransferase/cytidyltransferase family protein [Candidatus Gottesmanbacteria bacterium]